MPDLTAIFQHLGEYAEVTVSLNMDEDKVGRTMTVSLLSSTVTSVGLLRKNRVDAVSRTIMLPIKMKKPLY